MSELPPIPRPEKKEVKLPPIPRPVKIGASAVDDFVENPSKPYKFMSKVKNATERLFGSSRAVESLDVQIKTAETTPLTKIDSVVAVETLSRDTVAPACVFLAISSIESDVKNQIQASERTGADIRELRAALDRLGRLKELLPDSSPLDITGEYRTRLLSLLSDRKPDIRQAPKPIEAGGLSEAKYYRQPGNNEHDHARSGYGAQRWSGPTKVDVLDRESVIAEVERSNGKSINNASEAGLVLDLIALGSEVHTKLDSIIPKVYSPAGDTNDVRIRGNDISSRTQEVVASKVRAEIGLSGS